MTDTPEYVLPAGTPAKDIVKVLREYGVAIIPSYFSEDKLKKLIKEHEEIIEEATNGKGIQGVKITIYTEQLQFSKLVRAVREDLDGNRFPILTKEFASDLMKEIVEGYMGTPSTINDRIYLTWEVAEEKPITKNHLDPKFSLKFAVYLQRTDEMSGAFSYAPRSHIIGRDIFYQYFRRYKTRKGAPCFPGDIPSDRYNEMVRDLVRLDGNAGDMIIFDDDGLHSGGLIHEGHDRKTIRAVSGIPWEAQPYRYTDPKAPPPEKYTLLGLWTYSKGVVKNLLAR